MDELLKSEGKCVYCGELVDRDLIIKHLQKHVAAIQKAAEPTEEAVFLIKVSAREMFLVLLVKGNATFNMLDNFLRRIWLNCCGHLSGFSIKRSEVNGSAKLQSVMQLKPKINYVYDYGTSTYLEIKVVKEYRIKQKESILLLSRNEPLPILCSTCQKKPASVICTVHIYYDGEGFYCDDCAVLHEEECGDFADYAVLPVVNSPRMAVCGYDGGTIDKERDGVYVLK